MLHPSLLFADVEMFKGQYFHETPKGCEGKTILAFGPGNLGLDMEVGLCPEAKEKVGPSRAEGLS